MEIIQPSKEHLEELQRFLDLEQTVSADCIASILLKGREGSGKTTLLGTAPGPTLIDHFDISGVHAIDDKIKEGNILVRRWYSNKDSLASSYSHWSRQWEKDLKSGFLKLFNTYSIDSGTEWVRAMAKETIKQNPKSPRSGLGRKIVNIGDYLGMYSTIFDCIELSTTQVPIFILTFHTAITQDELTSEISYELDTFNQLKTSIPRLFTEKWVIDAAVGGERKVLVERSGRDRASTQIGAGKFLSKEEPNISNLIKKAGKEVPNKPHLSTHTKDKK